MTRIISHRRVLVFAAALFGAVLALPQISPAAAGPQDVAGAVRAKLNKSQFKNVQVSVDANGIATLSGTVSLYEYKADADKATHKVKGVTAVRNAIHVAGPSVPDSQLQKSLLEKLSYDRVGYGNEFDAITLNVRNGVATLGGHALDYPSRDSALALVATTPGIKDVIDNIEVDPVSPMDWGIRMAVARAIYGYTVVEQILPRSRQADPHFGAERQRGALRRGRFPDRQKSRRTPRQWCPRRFQRQELPAGCRPTG